MKGRLQTISDPCTAFAAAPDSDSWVEFSVITVSNENTNIILRTSGSSSVLAEKKFLRFPLGVGAVGFSRDIGEEIWGFLEFSPDIESIYAFECCGL